VLMARSAQTELSPGTRLARSSDRKNGITRAGRASATIAKSTTTHSMRHQRSTLRSGISGRPTGLGRRSSDVCKTPRAWKCMHGCRRGRDGPLPTKPVAEGSARDGDADRILLAFGLRTQTRLGNMRWMVRAGHQSKGSCWNASPPRRAKDILARMVANADQPHSARTRAMPAEAQWRFDRPIEDVASGSRIQMTRRLEARPLHDKVRKISQACPDVRDVPPAQRLPWESQQGLAGDRRANEEAAAFQ